MSKEGHEKTLPTTAEQSDPLVGKTIAERYTLRKKIGKGAFGAVYLADDLDVGTQVAIKILHGTVAQDPQVIERFRREALAASRLTHPNALKVLDRGEAEDGLLWLAMEFIDGQTLSEHLHACKNIPEKELIELLVPICEVLEEAHQKGIIHRDLKPQNIMLLSLPDGKFSPKVLDFGIAALLDADTLTKTGAISGTPQYMAPEQWEGLNKADARSDVYALGTITYQCLSGRLPFEASNTPEWMKKHYFDKPLDLMEAVRDKPLSLSVAGVVMRALRKRPEERYQSALDFKKAIEKAQLEPDATLDDNSAPPPPEAPTLPIIEEPSEIKEVRQKRIPLYLLGVLLLSLSLSGAYLYNFPDTKLAVQAPQTWPSAPSTKTGIFVPETQKAPVSTPEDPLSLAKKSADKKEWDQAIALAERTQQPELATLYRAEAKAEADLKTCRTLRDAGKPREALAACALIAPQTLAAKEGLAEISALKEKLRADQSSLAKKALDEKNKAELNRVLRELDWFTKLFGKDDPEVRALKAAYDEAEQKLGAILLLEEIRRNETNPKEMCIAAKQYIRKNPKSPELPNLKKKMGEHDPSAYPDCVLKLE